MVAIAEPPKKEQDRAEEIIRRFDKMKSDRGTLDAHLQEVAERVLPHKGTVTITKSKGQKKDPTIYDCTAEFANQKFASGLFSHLCSGKWFGLKARDKDLNESDDVKQWFMKTANILLEELAVSNFNLEIYELLLDLGWCGTPCISVKEGVETMLAFQTDHISEYVIAENSRKRVDTIYRKFKYTARQAVQEWGIENLGQAVRDAYDSEKPEDRDKEFEFIHAIYPREEYDDSYPALKSRQPIASEWVDVKGRKIIKVDGYYEMPKFTPRWVKLSNDVMGRSPGMSALPEIKMVIATRKVTIKSGEKGLDPPILCPDDGFIGTVRTSPGSIMYYRKSLQGKDKPEPFFTGAKLENGLEMIKDSRDIIKEAFFNPLFSMLRDQTKTQTAYEIAERIDEDNRQIIAPIGRLQSELFNGLIRAAIGILGRAGRLPGVPPELVGQEYEIEYISKLALALRILEVRTLPTALDIISPLVDNAPDMIDNYDTDEIARGVPERIGWPVEWLRDKDEVEEIREARAQKEQAMQLAELAAGAADAVPKISKKVEEGSPLAAMAGAV